MASLFGKGSTVKIEVHEQGIVELLERDKALRDSLVHQAQAIAAEAQATASSAEEGPGGRIHGYADAGFSVVWDGRGKRPRVNIVSNAPEDIALAAHFHTQKRDGVGHIRAALYKFTHRG